MRSFEDILHVSDRAIMNALDELDLVVVALSLKTATSALLRKFRLNMSEQEEEVVLEKMEAMGPVRLADVEDAQHTVSGVVFLHEVEDGDDGRDDA